MSFCFLFRWYYVLFDVVRFEDLVLPLLCFVCVFDVVRLVIFEDLFFLPVKCLITEREIEYYKK